MREDVKRITVSYDSNTYKKIEAIAHKENRSMSDVVREWTCQGLNGTLTAANLDILVPIIREQLQSVLEPKMERMIALQVKTCIQASTSTYLAADAILKFVPPGQRTEVKESYDAAKKQAIIYTKSKVDMNEEE